MRSHAARRARTAPTIRVPAFEGVGGGMKRLHRLKRIEQVQIVAFGATEMLSPQLKSQVTGICARAVTKARRIDGFPGIPYLVEHGACDF